MQQARLLLGLLADGERHDANRLAAALGAQLPALQAEVQVLTALGVSFAEQGAALRLRHPLDLLEPSLIRGNVAPAALALLDDIEVLLDVDSTNRHLMARVTGGEIGVRACMAERQSAGRGRQGKAWVSPFGASLYLSVSWPFAGGPATLAGLSIAVGVAVCESLETLGVDGLRLKWPNDLKLDGGKVGGVLVETCGTGGRGVNAVIGIGINAGLPADVAGIDQRWSDLASALGGRPPSRNLLAGRVLSALLPALSRFSQLGLAPFREAFLQRDELHGRVVVVHANPPLEGVAAGIDGDGALLLEVDGRLVRVLAGDVSVRARGEAVRA